MEARAFRGDQEARTRSAVHGGAMTTTNNDARPRRPAQLGSRGARYKCAIEPLRDRAMRLVTDDADPRAAVADTPRGTPLSFDLLE